MRQIAWLLCFEYDGKAKYPAQKCHPAGLAWLGTSPWALALKMKTLYSTPTTISKVQIIKLIAPMTSSFGMAAATEPELLEEKRLSADEFDMVPLKASAKRLRKTYRGLVPISPKTTAH